MGGYNENKIWIRDIFKLPKMEDGRDWIIWQFCNCGRLEGIEGFVDLNVLKGTRTDLERLLSGLNKE